MPSDTAKRISVLTEKNLTFVFLGTCIFIFAVLALRRLAGEWGYLWFLFGEGRGPGFDIVHFQYDMRLWFSGENLIEAVKDRPLYPPASYAMFYPLFGWLNFIQARVFWAFLSIPLLGWLVYLTVRSSGSRTRLEKIFWLLLPLAMNAVRVTIFSGQPGLIVMTALWSAFYFIYRHPPSWHRDFAVACLMTLSLLKPQFSLPFFWILLIRWRGLRPLALTFVGYTALTLYAISFQDLPWKELLAGWLDRGAAYAVGMRLNFLQGLLIDTGKSDWVLYFAFAVFFLLGMWLWRYRTADLWLLAGAAAIAARFWVYARSYGDLLMLIPLITIYRILTRRTLTLFEKGMGACLFIATLGILLIPEPFFLPGYKWNIYLSIFCTTVWLTLLGYIWYWAQRKTEAVV